MLQQRPRAANNVEKKKERRESEDKGVLYNWSWRRQWQPTPVLSPGESQGQGSVVGCRLWGRTESDTTEVT